MLSYYHLTGWVGWRLSDRVRMHHLVTYKPIFFGITRGLRKVRIGLELSRELKRLSLWNYTEYKIQNINYGGAVASTGLCMWIVWLIANTKYKYKMAWQKIRVCRGAVESAGVCMWMAWPRWIIGRPLPSLLAAAAACPNLDTGTI